MKLRLTPVKLAEWAGCFIGIAAAALLARHVRLSDYGWVGFLIANCCYIYYGTKTRAWGLVLQQSSFMVTSIMGIYNATW